MVLRSFRGLLLTLVAYTFGSVSATPSLSLSLSGPNFAYAAHDIKMTITLTNTGDKMLHVLKHPHSVLSDFPAEKFRITDGMGNMPFNFGGIRTFESSTDMIAVAAQTYVTLNPGQSVETIHDLSLSYDFTSSGAGVYTIRPNNAAFDIVESFNPRSVFKVEANIDRPHILLIPEIDAGQRFHWVNQSPKYRQKTREAVRTTSTTNATSSVPLESEGRPKL
ncbi:hypothetical protein CPC08DRAFT_754952 [Agrocybe pediades]|nr:hypothetical protein CPC08DRAFT_754952 [Agrocybe pediades]